MDNKKEKVRKSKYIAKRIPSFQLTKADAEVFHFVLNKFSKEYWDYKNNCLKKNKRLEIDFPISDIGKAFNKTMKTTSIYRDYVNSIERLIDFKYRIETKTQKRLYAVFPTIAYDKKQDIIKGAKIPKVYVKMNDNFVEHLIEIQNDFIQIELEQLGKFKSKYTYRIYDLVKSRSNGIYINFAMKINEFRNFLMLENKYKEFKNLRVKVIEPIQKDLEVSDLKATIELKRQGMKVVGIHFKNFGDPRQITTNEMLAKQQKPQKADANFDNEEAQKLWNDL